jgi:SRSO17 transposase
VDRLGSFLDVFKGCFSGTNAKTFASAGAYLQGLLSEVRRKNIERVAETREDWDYQNIQYCVSEAGWDHCEVIEGIGVYANGIFKGNRDTGLFIDESGVSKKGEKSVGVQRQWNGRLGKLDNCQVAVFGVLSARAAHCPIDVRLFLPESWVNDPVRCKESGIPEEERVFRTKHQLALAIIEDAVARGIDFKWVGIDAFYGRNRDLLRAIEDRGLEFVADVPENLLVRLPGSSKSVSVKELAQRRPLRRLTVRSQAKGKLIVDAFSVEVEVDLEDGDVRRWRLVGTREPKEGDFKYSLSCSQAPLRQLAFRQRQRFWVERSFQDGKTSCGMAQYQVRGWKAWHHHMALVMLALLFLLEERLSHAKTIPLLSCQDIVSILDSAIMHARQTDELRLEAMRVRHHQRYHDMKRAAAAQRPPPQPNRSQKRTLTK